MSRYERKQFFERLLALRDAYQATPHEATALTVDAVIAFAEQTFEALVAAETTATAATPSEPGTTPAG